jgi:eukaryotic-like serine/threonine-protein kinase
MVLIAGTRLGPYEIVSAIGAGGMGEVYRARDIRLDRTVAIKILNSALAASPDLKARFEREARSISQLNHPNICTLHDVGQHGGHDYLVMEFIDGESLVDRLRKGPLPIAEVVKIGCEIADALDRAHRAGIVHRDLKPGNVMLTKTGAKLLDFGLAKPTSMGAAASGSAPLLSAAMTMTSSPSPQHSPLTQQGALVGTVHYMSPEQIQGIEADARSDIFALGAVLYEMATAKHAFEGKSQISVASAILEKEPDPIVTTQPAAPAALDYCVRTCLNKNPDERFQTAHDVKLQLKWVAQSGTTQGPVATRRSRLWAAAIVLTLVAAVVSGAATFWRSSLSGRISSGGPLRRFNLDLPSKSTPNWNDFGVAISPDGTQIAYNCREGNAVSLCVRALDSLIVRRVADGRDAEDWFFSPDGEWLGIATEVGVSKVSVRGGDPQMIHRWQDTEPMPNGFSWGPDDYILLGTKSGILRIAASGGSPEAVSRIAPGSGPKALFWPSHMPDGRHALVTIVRDDGSESAGLVNLNDGSVRDLGIRGHGFVYVAPGWLAFQQGTTLLAVAFDPSKPERAANPVPVIENVRSAPRVARDGTLVYIPTRGESSARLVWVDREGRPTAVGSERLDYTHLDLASDGRRALLNLEGQKIDLIDLQGGTRKLVAQGSFPIWSSNGERVTFTGPAGLMWAPVDGSAPPELLVPHPGFVVATSWNAATGDLAYYDHRSFEIWIRSANGKTRRFLGGPGRKRSGRFSPDGKWMAFVSDETGEYQVYVTTYPGPGPTVAVSTRGGLSPIWSADGRELFFRLGSKMLAARMLSAQPISFSAPVELFDGPYTLDLMGHQREDVAPDGRRFLMVENSDDFPIVTVQNWPLELGRVVR